MIYEIAGLKVEITPNYDRLTRQCAAYASSGTPVMRVAPDPGDLARGALDTAEEQEYICCGAAFCRALIGHGRFFLHASAVVYEDAAYLFSGPSGTGKSTHTALWRELFPGSYILNDDKPVLQPGPKGVTVWGTPFAGKTNLQVNRGVPLKGICFLKQGMENHIRPVTDAEALSLLLNNTWRPKNSHDMALLLDMVEEVMMRTNVYELFCTTEPEAAKLSYRMMKGM